MGILFFMFVLVLVFWAAIQDVLTLKIPNEIPAGIGLAFVAVVFLDPAFVMDIEGRLISAAILFVSTFVLFTLGLLGAGDSKLLAVLGLWMPAGKLASFVFAMALAGFVLGVLGLVARKSKYSFFTKKRTKAHWFSQLRAGRSAVPYAVAIAAGFCAVFI